MYIFNSATVCMGQLSGKLLADVSIRTPAKSLSLAIHLAPLERTFVHVGVVQLQSGFYDIDRL